MYEAVAACMLGTNSRFISFTIISPVQQWKVPRLDDQRVIFVFSCSFQTDHGQRDLLSTLVDHPDFHQFPGGIFRSWILHIFLALHCVHIRFIGMHGLLANMFTIPKILREFYDGWERILV